MIKINGKLPVAPRVRTWRELEGYNPLAGDKIDVNGCIERIALVYGLSVEEVEEHLELSDMLTCYVDCVEYVNNVIFEKLNGIPKNADGDRT